MTVLSASAGRNAHTHTGTYWGSSTVDTALSLTSPVWSAGQSKYFVAAQNGHFRYSYDAVTWGLLTSISVSGDVALLDLETTGALVAMVVNGTDAGAIYYSTNWGSSWSPAATRTFTSIALNQVASNGADTIIYTTGSNAYYSTNLGASWTTITLPVGLAHIDGIFYANSLWIFAGADGSGVTKLFSTTALSATPTFTSHTLPTLSNGSVIESVSYGSSKWLLAGAFLSGAVTTGTVYKGTSLDSWTAWFTSPGQQFFYSTYIPSTSTFAVADASHHIYSLDPTGGILSKQDAGFAIGPFAAH